VPAQHPTANAPHQGPFRRTVVDASTWARQPPPSAAFNEKRGAERRISRCSSRCSSSNKSIRSGTGCLPSPDPLSFGCPPSHYAPLLLPKPTSPSRTPSPRVAHAWRRAPALSRRFAPSGRRDVSRGKCTGAQRHARPRWTGAARGSAAQNPPARFPPRSPRPRLATSGLQPAARRHFLPPRATGAAQRGAHVGGGPVNARRRAAFHLDRLEDPVTSDVHRCQPHR
jgi:hypothetical protein